MAYVIAAPRMMGAATTDLATIGSTLSAAHMAAVAPTLAVIPAAADEVSQSIAHLLSQDCQALAGKAAAFQEQFAQHLTASGSSYASTEAANAALWQPLTAIAGAGAGLQDQLGTLLTSANAVVGQLVNQLITFIVGSPLVLNLIVAVQIPIYFVSFGNYDSLLYYSFWYLVNSVLAFSAFDMPAKWTAAMTTHSVGTPGSRGWLGRKVR